MTTADSKTAFTGIALVVFLKAVRVSMSVSSIAVVVERGSTFVNVPPTAQGGHYARWRAMGGWGEDNYSARSDS